MRSRRSRSRHAGHATVEVEVLIGRERAVDGYRLGDVADAGAHAQAVVADVVAGHERAALGGLEQRGEHADGGRLARAVGPEQAEHLARSDREGDAADGRRARRSARPGRRRARPAALIWSQHLPLAGGEGARRVAASSSRILRRTRLRVSDSSCSSLASSAARRRTSSSWRSMWPSASVSSSRRRTRVDVLAAQLGAHLRARLLGGEQRFQLLERDARAGPSGASPRAGARPRPRCRGDAARRAARAPRRAGRSPRSSGSCAASCRPGGRRRRCAGSRAGLALGRLRVGRVMSIARAQRAPRARRGRGAGAVSSAAAALASASWRSRGRSEGLLGRGARQRSSRCSGPVVARAQQADDRSEQRGRREHPQRDVHVGDERRELLLRRGPS